MIQTFDYTDSMYLFETSGLITSIDLSKYPFFDHQKDPTKPWPFHPKAIEDTLDTMTWAHAFHVCCLHYTPEHIRVYLIMKHGLK